MPQPSGRPSHAEPVSIMPYRDGPYVVRGEFRVLSQDGEEIPLGRRTVALCRCGKSRMRPFCDGTHRVVGFEAAGSAEDYDGPPRAPLTRRATPDRAPSAPSATEPSPARRPVEEPEQPPDRLSGPLARVELAQRSLAMSIGGPCDEEDYLALRMAEPFLRSACALLETRALRAPEPLPTDPLLLGGRRVLGALVADALAATAESAEEEGDVVLETAAALLLDASRLLEGARS
jgi:CDGSH-type Zn-finger protein